MKKLDKFALIQLAPLQTGHRKPIGIDLKGKEEFIFINSQGEIVEYKNDEDDENILHVNGINELFNIEDEDFVEEEEDYDGYDYEDDYNYERDTYYALGGDDYDRWKEI